MSRMVGGGRARVLDANANRAREGIRTAEDYFRFVLEDEVRFKALRKLRHAVTAAVEEFFDETALPAARNVAGDSGAPRTRETEKTGGAEAEETPRETALRGLKRAQEALRVLEEYGRAVSAKAATAFAQKRFNLYEAEQGLARGIGSAKNLRETRVYVLLSEEGCPRGLEKTAAAVLRGGARVLQLREKKVSDRIYVERVSRLRGICSEQGAALFVNDRADLAAVGGADGVHLGADDLTPGEVRRCLGERLLVGKTVHSAAEVEEALRDPAVDYLAVGTVFHSPTKPERKPAGVELVRRAAELCATAETGKPLFAVGGINIENARELPRAGVCRAAVASAATAAADPEGTVRRLVEILEG